MLTGWSSLINVFFLSNNPSGHWFSRDKSHIYFLLAISCCWFIFVVATFWCFFVFHGLSLVQAQCKFKGSHQVAPPWLMTVTLLTEGFTSSGSNSGDGFSGSSELQTVTSPFLWACHRLLPTPQLD